MIYFQLKKLGIYKPNSKVYDIPIKKYQIEKNEVAFLSANTWDVSGGGNYGYQSIWVNRNNNIFDNLDYEPKNQIKNLKDLLPKMNLSFISILSHVFWNSFIFPIHEMIFQFSLLGMFLVVEIMVMWINLFG